MLIEECNAGRFNSQSTSNAWWAVSKLVPSTHALFSPLLHALETALLGCLASSASEAERPNSQVGVLGGNGVHGWAVTRWQLLHQPAWRTAAPGLHLHTGPQPLLLHHDFPPTFLLDPSHTFPFVLPLPPPSWQAVSSIFYAWGRLDGYLPGGTVLQLMWERTLHLALTFDTQGGHSLVIAGAGQAAGVRGLPPPLTQGYTRHAVAVAQLHIAGASRFCLEHDLLLAPTMPCRRCQHSVVAGNDQEEVWVGNAATLVDPACAPSDSALRMPGLSYCWRMWEFCKAHIAASNFLCSPAHLLAFLLTPGNWLPQGCFCHPHRRAVGAGLPAAAHCQLHGSPGGWCGGRIQRSTPRRESSCTLLHSAWGRKGLD